MLQLENELVKLIGKSEICARIDSSTKKLYAKSEDQFAVTYGEYVFFFFVLHVFSDTCSWFPRRSCIV